MFRTQAIAAVALLLAPVALAGDERPPVVEYRHQVMEAAGKHMYMSKLIMQGKVDRPKDLVAHAQALNDIAMIFPELFPEGTGPDKVPTDSLASVWEKKKDFTKANKAFQDATSNLVEVAKKGDMDAYKQAFGAVGKSCGGCHDDFRKDEDH